MTQFFGAFTVDSRIRQTERAVTELVWKTVMFVLCFLGLFCSPFFWACLASEWYLWVYGARRWDDLIVYSALFLSVCFGLPLSYPILIAFVVYVASEQLNIPHWKLTLSFLMLVYFRSEQVAQNHFKVVYWLSPFELPYLLFFISHFILFAYYNSSKAFFSL